MSSAGPVRFGPEKQEQNAEAADAHSDWILRDPVTIGHDNSFKPWAERVAIERKKLTQEQLPRITEIMEETVVGLLRLVDFRSAARVIFGTQVLVLRLLSISANGMTRDQLQPEFERHEELVKAHDDKLQPDMLTWIQFHQASLR